MSIKFRVDANKNLLIAIVAGHVDPTETHSFLRRIQSARVGKNLLIWLQDTKPQAVDVNDYARTATGLYGADTGEYQTAIVAQSNREFALARQYQSYRNTSGRAWEIFRNIKAAARWLGLNNEAAVEGENPEFVSWHYVTHDSSSAQSHPIPEVLRRDICSSSQYHLYHRSKVLTN